MAWVDQTFHHEAFSLTLYGESIEFEFDSDQRITTFTPQSSEDARVMAMMFRKAARRLEEIGKEMLDGKK